MNLDDVIKLVLDSISELNLQLEDSQKLEA